MLKEIINGGDAGNNKHIYAGYIHGNGDATSNIITITGGKVGGADNINIYGAGVANGSATGNKVNISGGTFGKNATIYGVILYDNNSDASISGNEVNITGGTFDDKIIIYGGQASSGTAKIVENNKVTIKNISVANESTIYGGNASATLVKGNGVTVENATFGNTVKVYGGYTESKDAEGNFVTIKSSTFGTNSEIYGAYTDTGNAGGDSEDKGNKVIIDGGGFGDGSAIYGGYGSGNTNNNIVTIKSGTFGSTTFYGGKSSGGSAEHNTINIFGGTFANGFMLYGGHASTSTNNTLNLKIKMGGKASEVKFFQNMIFTLPTGIQAGAIMLETASATYDNTKVDVTSDVGVSLKKNDKIYLIKADEGTGGIDTTNLTVLDGAGAVSLEDDKNLVLTLLKDLKMTQMCYLKHLIKG